MTTALSFDILTIFPGMFTGVLGESIVARALAQGLARVELTDIRDFAAGRHRSVDDRPYGGGPGMVFKPEPVLAAVEKVIGAARAAPEATRRIILTPQGIPLTQGRLHDLARAEWIVLLCGHYEGFDERILDELREEKGFEEVSAGDFVLSGGEIPAMAIVDGVVRLLPGALGHPLSAQEESFENGVLDFPQYTRPPEFRGRRVPDILLSGNHERIEAWRREESLKRTRERRKDLLDEGQPCFPPLTPPRGQDPPLAPPRGQGEASSLITPSRGAGRDSRTAAAGGVSTEGTGSWKS